MFLIVNVGKDNAGATMNMFSRESLYDDILEQLKCPRCKEYWRRQRITMCEQGHTICHSCGFHIPSLAHCTGQSSNVTNVVLENIVATAIYPCPFTQSHVTCYWSGNPFEIEMHVRTEHESQCLADGGECKWIELPIRSRQDYQKVIFTSQNLFLILCSETQEFLRISVFLVGRKSDFSGFIYDIRVLRPGGSDSRMSESGLVCRNYLEDNVFESGECVQWHLISLQKYLTPENAILCSINIRKERENNNPVEPMDISTYVPDSSNYVPNIH